MSNAAASKSGQEPFQNDSTTSMSGKFGPKSVSTSQFQSSDVESKLSSLAVNMGLLMLKTACKTDPEMFEEVFTMLEHALEGMLSPLALYNTKPLSPRISNVFSKLRSAFASMAIHKKAYHLDDSAVQEFVRFLLSLGISRGNVSDIVEVARLLILHHNNHDVNVPSSSENGNGELGKSSSSETHHLIRQSLLFLEEFEPL